MSLFRPWQIGSCVEGGMVDPNTEWTHTGMGPGMGLALTLPDEFHPADTLTNGICENELSNPNANSESQSNQSTLKKDRSSTNGTLESGKSIYSYYYQYYYSQLLYYASMQHQSNSLSQHSASLINKVTTTNCRSSSSPSSLNVGETHHRIRPPGSSNMTTTSDNNNNRNHNANNIAASNERLQAPTLNTNKPQHKLPLTNRSQTESTSTLPFDSTDRTRNPSSGTNKRACEKANQLSCKGATVALLGKTTNLSSNNTGKRSNGTECRAATTTIPNSVSPANGFTAPTSRTKTPSMTDLQNILTFQNLFLDSIAAKKRAAAKSAVDQRPKKFICAECKSGFSNRSQLNSHIRTHTGMRYHDDTLKLIDSNLRFKVEQ